MPIDPQYPVDVAGHFDGDLKQGCGELGKLAFAGLTDLGLAFGKQQFGLQHKSITDNAHVVAVADHFTEPAKEFRAIACEFLHLTRKRCVEALPQGLDLDVFFLSLGLGCFKCSVQRV